MLKNKWTLLIANFILTLILFILFAPDYNLLHFIDSFFYICFGYLLLFLFMYTAKGGFFDGVTFGFRRFQHVIIKKDDYLDEWREKPLPSEKMHLGFYHLLKFQSVAMVVLLLAMLVLYYLFTR